MADRDAGSGTNDPQTIHDNAKAHYKNFMKREFDNQACWDVLKAMPKFSTHSGKGDDGSAWTNVTTTSDRPEGTKAAKRKAKMEDRADKRAKTLDAIGGNISKIAQAIVGFREDQKTKDEEERLMKNVKFYKDMGDEATYQDFMIQLKTLQLRRTRAVPLAVETTGSPLSAANSESTTL